MTASAAAGMAPGADGNLWFTVGSETTTAIGRITPSGHITQFSADLNSASLPGAVAPGADGNLWFADFSGAIGRITPSGHITEFSAGLNSGSRPFGIAPGAGGNLWFTRYGRDHPRGRAPRRVRSPSSR
jgi:virginiamycin B lyase